MVALNGPTQSNAVRIAADFLAIMKPHSVDVRPESERLRSMIRNFKFSIANGNMSPDMKRDFERDVAEMEARLAELRRQGQDAEPAPSDERQNPAP